MAVIEGITHTVGQQAVQPSVRKNVFTEILKAAILGMHILLPRPEGTVYFFYQVFGRQALEVFH